jgi:hypothetical protein
MRRFQASCVYPFALILLLGFVVCGAQECVAAAPKKKETGKPVAGDPLPKMTRDQRRFFYRTQKQLVTKLNGKDNPGDSKTWYTLLFLDEVAIQTLGASSSSSQQSVTLATMLAAKPDGVVIQGKQDAALAVGQFMYGSNNAAKGLKAPSTSESRNSTRAAGNKRWWFFAFKTKQEAEKRLLLAIPQNAKK